ncbi:MAG TPA: nuclear transport factor 2 family protein [Kofleriaceae bacterium]|nr:nuclear transport factor 2 family protein [Kofleriaceae bacterium]
MDNNISPVRAVYECLERADIDGAVANFADDCEIELMGPGSIPFAGTYRGERGMRDFLNKFMSSADILEFGPDEFHGADGFVTVIGHEHARSKTTGREWNTRLVDTWEVRDGKIHKFLCSYDTASVADAFSGTAAAPAEASDTTVSARA